MPGNWLARSTMARVNVAPWKAMNVLFFAVLCHSGSCSTVDLFARILCCCRLCMTAQMAWFNMVCRVVPLVLGVMCMQLNKHQSLSKE